MIPRSELYYFVPGQVILHLEHEVGIGSATITQAVINFLQLPESPWNKINLKRITTMPVLRSNGNEISLVSTEFPPPYDPENVKYNQGYLIALLGEMYDWIDKYSPKQKPYVLAPGITLLTVSPNWLTSGAPHQPATGGPGSWPVPASQPGAGQAKFNFPGMPNSADIINDSAGQNVEVAILDTAPTAEDETSVHDHWKDQRLIQELLGNNRVLEIERYTFTGLEIISHISLMGHRYEMPDHGLFVAGIIHTIAPQAHLKLYEVLNLYGAGNYESIYTGLSYVLEDLEHSREGNPGHKLVINLSLMVNMPLVDLKRMWFLHADPGITDIYAEKINHIFRMSESIREIFAQLVNLDNVLVVAAAGNDYKGIIRPSARYPASCQGVIGVGALPKNSQSELIGRHKTASYSNLCDQPPHADRPPYSGYVTLGGEPGEYEGVLGVYLHGFPVDQGSKDTNYPAHKPQSGYLRGADDYSPDLSEIEYIPNNSGWAWWAGTSFATPIISGLLAAGWSKNWNDSDMLSIPWPGATITSIRAHNFLFGASGTQRTGIDERVIIVTQT